MFLAAQPGEELQPEEPAGGAAAPAAPAAPQPDDTIVAQLVSMGFSENGSKRAALAVRRGGGAGGGPGGGLVSAWPT